MELKTYKNKTLMSLLQRKIDQKAYFRTSKMQMHFFMLSSYLSRIFNTITVHSPLHLSCLKLFPLKIIKTARPRF